MRIAVVGAGIAGLACARALAERRHDVAVFDRAPAPGGRAGSRRVSNDDAAAPELASLTFDHGAQYFTARHSDFDREAQAWHKARVVSVWHGKLASFDSEGREAVEDEVMRWVGVPAMNAIARHLARGLDVRCGVEVTAIAHDASSTWSVTSESTGTVGTPGTHGTADQYDALVLAVPPPEAIDLLREVRLKPDTTSELHGIMDGLQGARMLPCWAALAAFDARVPTRFDAAFVSSSPLGWIARDRSKPQRGFAETWVLHATTAWSAAHVDDRADAVGPFLLNAFADLVRGPMPRPASLTTHRWRYATADPPLARGALGDPALGLALCGDWCRGNRIEDAWLSGVAAAAMLGIRPPAGD